MLIRAPLSAMRRHCSSVRPAQWLYVWPSRDSPLASSASRSSIHMPISATTLNPCSAANVQVSTLGVMSNIRIVSSWSAELK